MSEPQTRTRAQKPLSYITIILLTLYVAMFFVMEILGGSERISVLIQCGAKVNLYIVGRNEWWRLITATFLHAGIMHLAFNGMSLYFWGPTIEILFGKWKFLCLYMMAGFLGSAASFAFSASVSVGASGAIFGLLGGILYLRTQHKEAFKRFFGVQVFLIIGLNLYNGFVNSGIDNFGHIGGLIGGFLAAGAVGLMHQKGFTTQKALYLAGYVFLAAVLLFVGKNGYFWL